MADSILELIEKRTMLLDGGMGTELMKHGFSQGECPEKWNIEKPDVIKEALCALRAARKNASCPVFVTMTFEKYPKGFFTMMGNSVSQCIADLKDESVPVIGANCTLDSADMADLIKSMRESTSLPLIAQANAGKATLSSEGEVAYSQGIENYVKYVPQIKENGASLIGGCCGTDPEYIRHISQLLTSKPS